MKETTWVTGRCLCGMDTANPELIHGLTMARCPVCGVLRQVVEMTAPQLSEWYAGRYFEGVYTHTYEHDRDVAAMRLGAYGLTEGDRLLDVGAGNGAFVNLAAERGIRAWGQDLASAANGDVWVGELESCAFPPQSFDVVTLHDVLEHVPDPVAMLEEIARTLVPGGRLIVDWPRFHHPAGVHHWKKTEHLWMLTDHQLKELLEVAGFKVEKIEHPIESKTVVYTRSQWTASPARILVPPGIGDGYWVMAKLRGILAEHSMWLPELFVHDSGPQRAAGFWSRCPLTRFGGYAKIESCPEWSRAYSPPGQPVQYNVQGFDMFLSFNGTMDGGLSLEEAHPGPVNWHEPLFMPKDHRDQVVQYREKFGPYVVVACWDRGFYKEWLRSFGILQFKATLSKLADDGMTIVVMGADWDRGRIASTLAGMDSRFVDLIGDTDFDQLTALVEGASLVLGHPAGNTMLGPYLGTPTVLLWGNTFPDAFRVNALPPRGDYVPLDVRGLSPHTVYEAVTGLK